MVEKLHFNRRKGEWRGKPPPSRAQEWANKDDDWHSGFIVGLATSGLLSVVIYGLGLILG